MTVRSLLSLGLCGAATGLSLAQLIPSVDLLSPGDPGYEGLPTGIAVVDYFVDVARTDVWTVAATELRTQNTATIVYARDPNDSIILVNPGLDQRNTTFVSRPRGRDAAERFENGGVAVAGNYGTAPTPIVEPTWFSASWFRSPPASSATPSADGFVARVAIDLGDFAPRRDSLQRSLTPPDSAFPILASSTHPIYGPGWVNGTFDQPTNVGISWYLFDPVPEPASLALWVVTLGMLARSFRKPFLKEIAQ